jgi:hypothetical protein
MTGEAERQAFTQLRRTLSGWLVVSGALSSRYRCLLPLDYRWSNAHFTFSAIVDDSKKLCDNATNEAVLIRQHAEVALRILEERGEGDALIPEPMRRALHLKPTGSGSEVEDLQWSEMLEGNTWQNALG